MHLDDWGFSRVKQEMVKDVYCCGWIVFDVGWIENKEFYQHCGYTACQLTETASADPNDGGEMDILKGSDT